MIFRLLKVALCAGTLLTAAPAHAEWLKAETDHFIIYGDTSERGIRAYAEKVERFDALLRAYYPIPVDYVIPKLEIYLARGHDDLRRVSPGIGANIGGFYAPNSSRIHAVANVESELADDVVFHEYGHHFMFQMASAAYPAWFVEGFAEYYANVRIRDDGYEIGGRNEGRLRSLNQALNSWPPLEDVLRWRVSASGRMRGSDYYAISWALTHYMLADPERTRALGRYLAAVSRGADPVEALQAETGKTPSQLRSEVKRYVTGTTMALRPQITVPEIAVTVERLPPDQARLVWLDLRLDRVDPRAPAPAPTRRDGETDAARESRTAEARADYAEARSALSWDALTAASAAGDGRTARLVRARGERLADRTAEAIETLAPLTADDSTDGKALRLSGEYHLDLADLAEGDVARALRVRARSDLARALQADPLDFQVYLALDRMRQGQAGYPSANDLQTLQAANGLAPQSLDARLRLGRALIAVEDYPAAIAALGPVANSPHASPLRAQGVTFMAQARAAAGLAANDPGEPPPEEAADPEA